MKTIPNFAVMLPSKVKAEVVKFYYDQLVSAKLDWHVNPMYRGNDAVGDARLFKNEYAESMWHECFALALEQYEREYPKGMEDMKFFRTGPDSRRLYSFESAFDMIKGETDRLFTSKK
jgi:hypothetical protein